MSKYIIKNCPAFAKGIFCKGGDIIDDGCADKTLDRNTLISCQDCTDCVMKQIAGLCKETCRKRCTNDCLGTKKHCGYGQILKLLDIQEVE